jgi:hypothetical protein
LDSLLAALSYFGLGVAGPGLGAGQRSRYRAASCAPGGGDDGLPASGLVAALTACLWCLDRPFIFGARVGSVGRCGRVRVQRAVVLQARLQHGTLWTACPSACCHSNPVQDCFPTSMQPFLACADSLQRPPKPPTPPPGCWRRLPISSKAPAAPPAPRRHSKHPTPPLPHTYSLTLHSTHSPDKPARFLL